MRLPLRNLRFRIRALLLLLTAGSLILGFVSARFRARGDLALDLERRGNDVVSIQPTGIWGLLRPVTEAVYGPKAALDIGEVHFGGWRIEDDQMTLVKGGFDTETLRRLSGLPRLYRLDFSGTELKDADLDTLARLDDLKILVLDGTNVTDDAIERLSAMRSLHSLSLIDTEISGRGVEELRRRRPGLEIRRSHVESFGRDISVTGDQTLVAP